MQLRLDRRPKPAATRERLAAENPKPVVTARATTATAAIASPTGDLEAATAKLWLRLRQQLTASGLAALVDAEGAAGLVVTGPQESTDSYGRVWFWFRGTVQVERAPAVCAGPAAEASACEGLALRAATGSASMNRLAAIRGPRGARGARPWRQAW